MTPLSWSNTRITVLEYCQKKYFFNYYSHGLKQISHELWLKAKILKQLKSLDMWMGEMTHRIISIYLFDLKNHLLENGVKPDKERIFNEITIAMKNAFLISEQNDYNNFIEFGLSEHYYREIDSNALNDTIKKVINNLEVFIASDYHKRVEQRLIKGHHIYIENPQHPNFEMMKVHIQHIPGLENVSVLANPDFGLMLGDNKYIILDWKSGKESLDVSGITDQLRVYALKLLLKQSSTKLENRQIETYEIYLPSLHEKGGTIQQEDIDAIIAKILEDVEYQKQFLVDHDIERNEPLNHTSFARTSHEKKCISCTFRAVCQQLKTQEEAI